MYIEVERCISVALKDEVLGTTTIWTFPNKEALSMAIAIAGEATTDRKVMAVKILRASGLSPELKSLKGAVGFVNLIIWEGPDKMRNITAIQ